MRSVLALGNLPVCGFPVEWSGPHMNAPLDLVQCSTCGLVQLTETVPREALYGGEYWYRSGLNEAMRIELANVAQSAISMAQPKPGDLIVDVGANDGTLLSMFAGGVATTVAFEPSAFNLSHVADTRLRWFPEEAAGLPDASVAILASIAMFYDVDDPNLFCAEVARVLRYGGVWIVQFQDLRQVAHANAFDDICHEHLCYYSLGTFQQLVARHGLQVVSAEVRDINGGSLRCYVQHRGQYVDRSVARLLNLEVELDAHLEAFASRVPRLIRDIRRTVERAGEPIDVYGASTKGNTLLAACGLDARTLRQAIERSGAKVGRHYGATGIPIVSEEAGRADPASAWLVPIWQFRDQVVAREQEYLAAGGRLIFPLPTPAIVGKAKEAA